MRMKSRSGPPEYQMVAVHGPVSVYTVVQTTVQRSHGRWNSIPGSPGRVAFKQATDRIPIRPHATPDAFLLCDLFRLIRRTSTDCGNNPRLFSLLSFSLYTGTRLSDVAGLTLHGPKSGGRLTGAGEAGWPPQRSGELYEILPPISPYLMNISQL